MHAASPRRILVTGAGSGIGRATALRLLASGCDVAVHGRRPDRLEGFARRAHLHQRSVRPVVFDLADRPATASALAGLLQEWPEIHGVVLNAGSSGHDFLEAPDTAEWDRLLDVNLASCFRILRPLIPHIPAGGRIVAVGSVLGRFGVPHAHGYGAAKAGVMGLVRALALDLATRQITVNAVLPGWVDTPLAEASIARQAPLLGLAPEEARTRFEKAVPIGRFLEPREVARLIVHLLSPEAGGITGEAMNICGGVLA